MSPGKVVGALAPMAVAALLLVACGDDSTDDGAALGAEVGASPDASPGPGTGLTIEAHDIDFDRDAYRIAAGAMEIEYIQKGAVPHSLVIETSDGGDVDGFKLEVGDVDAVSATVDLSPGDYVVYCDVPGHRRAGMEAELQVDRARRLPLSAA